MDYATIALITGISTLVLAGVAAGLGCYFHTSKYIKSVFENISLNDSERIAMIKKYFFFSLCMLANFMLFIAVISLGIYNGYVLTGFLSFPFAINCFLISYFIMGKDYFKRHIIGR